MQVRSEKLLIKAGNNNHVDLFNDQVDFTNDQVINHEIASRNLSFEILKPAKPSRRSW